MSFFEKQWKLIVGVCLVIFVVGAAAVIRSTVSLSHEKKLQENFYMIEKKYTEYKTKKNKPAESEATKSAKKTDPKDVEITPAALAELKTQVQADLEKFISDNPGAKATQMAAIYDAEILKEDKKSDQALVVLQKVQNSDHGLVNTLVQQQIGQMLANLDKCQEAISSWQKILDRKEAEFLHNDVRIQQALCYQKLNDTKKAEELLTNIANQKTDGRSDSSSTKEAARYLRLIQFKKVSGT